MLLMFPTGTLDRNQLLFAVAAYNFANFMVKEFDLSFEEAGPMSMLTIHGFFNLDEIFHHKIGKVIGGNGKKQLVTIECSGREH